MPVVIAIIAILALMLLAALSKAKAKGQSIACLNKLGFAGGDLWDDVPADRHSRGANLSFVDGHAEFQLWRAPKPKEYGARAVGEDLTDLHWLQDRVPTP